MAFFNHFTNININIDNFYSGFGGLVSPCLGNFSFINNFGFNNFNFGMPIFNNFGWFNGFTNYPSINDISANSLWNTTLTNIRPPTFSNCDWNTANFNNWDCNFMSPKWNTCNFDTFDHSTHTKNYSSSILDKIPSDYDKNKGKKLANIALKNQKGFSGYCATYVKNAIQEAGLGSYISGDAYQMGSILRNNRNFKEISASSVNVEDLPAGCILVYDKGAQGYSSLYGHTEITTGDGRAVSDGITNNLHKQPSAIFVPITA